MRSVAKDLKDMVAKSRGNNNKNAYADNDADEVVDLDDT